MSEEEKKELIISTIQNEKHLGDNLKRILISYIEELEKELKDYRELTDKYEEEHRTTFKELCNSLGNSIPKQKIRDKIEELESYKGLVMYEKYNYEVIIKHLQELLEKGDK